MKITGPPINKSFLLLTALIIGILLFISFLGAFAEDEGTLSSDDRVGNFLAGLFYVLRFPTHTLCWSYISGSGMFVFWAGLFVNCIFYAFLAERAFSITRSLVNRFRNKKTKL